MDTAALGHYATAPSIKITLHFQHQYTNRINSLYLLLYFIFYYKI